MNKKMKIEIEREVKPFYDLDHGSFVLLEKSEETAEGSYYTIMSSLFFTAFSFEAYLNHLGKEKIKFWDKIDRISVLDKYEVLCSEYNIDILKGERPYQTVVQLFKFRNDLAHGKTEMLFKCEEIESMDDRHGHDPKTRWEKFCNLDNAKRSREDVRALIKQLHLCSGEGEFPFTSGMTMGHISG